MSISAMRWISRALVAVVATVAFAGGAAAAPLVEGKSYQRLSNPQPVETGKKIEVIEFFSYGCPHCAEFEPLLDAWLTKLPPDVEFRRVPVTFFDAWVPYAKDFYTLDALGVAAKLSPDVFKAIHGEGVALGKDKTFFDWAASKGVDRKKIEDVYGSFAVDGKMKRAIQLGRVYRIESVPTLVIDGKFKINPETVGSHAAMLTATDELIVKARAERPKS